MENILESRVGKVSIILYALFAIATFVYVFWCGSSTCNVYVVLPVMPWAYIFGSDMGLALPVAIYPIFILLNTSVAYVVGAGIEWVYRHIAEKE
jgi:hypothetical protein